MDEIRKKERRWRRGTTDKATGKIERMQGKKREKESQS